MGISKDGNCDTTIAKMGLGRGGTCMKYLLFLFNFVFFVCGAVILGVGIWVRVDPTIADFVGLTIEKGSYEAATILLIVVGASILLVGFLGCCGACQESTCMLNLFAALMVIIVLLQIVAAILAVVFQSEVENELKDHLAQEMREKVKEDSADPFTQTVNRLQMEFKCCGTVNYLDYGEESTIYNETTKYVPKSCCTKATGDYGNPTLSDEDWEACSNAARSGGDTVKKEGCYDALVDWLKAHAVIVIGVGFGLAVIEILGIVFACCVRGKIAEGDQY